MKEKMVSVPQLISSTQSDLEKPVYIKLFESLCELDAGSPILVRHIPSSGMPYVISEIGLREAKSPILKPASSEFTFPVMHKRKVYPNGFQVLGHVPLRIGPRDMVVTDLKRINHYLPSNFNLKVYRDL